MRVAFGSRDSRSFANVIVKAAIPIGTLRKNTQRQPAHP
jgi:hypothetical protein